MSTTDDRRSTSMGKLIKTPSETPSSSPSFRSQNKKMKSSKSVVSMKSSEMPQTESTHTEKPTSEIVETKKPEIPRDCRCVPDLYSRVLGPTADETILTGLQTVIDLCNRLRVCGDGDESDQEEPEKEENVPVKDTSSRMKTSNSQTPRNSVSAAFQVNPNVKVVSTQTLPFPQMVSEILQTVGLTPEMVSKVMQTSFADLTQPKKASMTSINVQTSNAALKSNFMQTSVPDVKSGLVQTSSGLLPILKSNIIQTSSVLLPTLNAQSLTPPPKEDAKNSVTQYEKTRTDSVKTQSDQVKTFSKTTMPDRGSLLLPPKLEKSVQSDIMSAKGDEHKAISPPEPPETLEKHGVGCKCCECSTSTSRSSLTKKSCICGRRRSKCKCNSSKLKRSNTSLGHRERNPPLEIKYAITRISKFKEFTTFEIMKSTKNQPRQIPKGIEGVFVMKRKIGDSDADQKVLKNESNGKNSSKMSKARSGEGEK